MTVLPQPHPALLTSGGVGTAAPPRRRLTRVLLVAATVGSMFLSVAIGPGLAPVDLVFAVVILIGFSRLGASGPEVRRLLGVLLPWVWLILLGSTLALFGVGVRSWAVDGLFRDAFVLAIFFAVCELASDSRIRYALLMKATLLALVLVEVAIFAGAGSYRPTGTFDNPNYAGHFLVLGLLLLLRASTFPLVVKAATTASAVTALFFTGSFGGVAMLFGGVAYLLWARLRTHPVLLAKAGYGLMLCIAILSSVYFAYGVVANHVHLSNSVNTARIDRSAGSRLDLWHEGLSRLGEHPLGVGPEGLAHRDLLGRSVEIHNDYLAYLIERGPLGLLGLLAFGLALWLFGGRFGATRLLLVAIAIGMMTRETLHFRHLWLFLAFAVAYDIRSRRVGAP